MTTLESRSGVQGHEREVTERHMTEENLHISAQRYQSLFEDSPFPMWEEDFSSVKLYLDELIASGVTDLRARLTACRRAISKSVSGVSAYWTSTARPASSTA